VKLAVAFPTAAHVAVTDAGVDCSCENVTVSPTLQFGYVTV